MNKNILIASASALGAASVLFYMWKRRKAHTNNMEPAHAKHSRHLTDAFSKAKQHYANGSNGTPTMSDKVL